MVIVGLKALNYFTLILDIFIEVCHNNDVELRQEALVIVELYNIGESACLRQRPDCMHY